MNSFSQGSVASRLAHVERFFSTDVANFKRRLAELDAVIDANAKPQRGDSFHIQVLAAFNESQEACGRFQAEYGDDPAVIKEVQEAFRRETALWFNQSWIAHRARTKPNGFAGDYEMLIKLYEEATPALGLGGYLDLCILDLQLARAVRARLQAIRAFLISEIKCREGDVRVLDIACGPCREFVDWPQRLDDGKVEILAMDNDPKALEYIETQVAPLLDGKTQLIATRYNALRTRSAEATNRKFGKFDIIYSVGLCDYLSDDHLIGILEGLRNSLREGGVLFIAFKDAERYDKTPYQWHLDWYFFQRQMNDCLRLYERAGFEIGTMETMRDDTGIIINFVSRPVRRTFVRTDMPESLTPEGRVSPIQDSAKSE